VLREMDVRWAIFCLCLPGKHLGSIRKTRFVWKERFSARATDFWAHELLVAAAQQGWQETVRRWWAGAWRTLALRRQVCTVLSVSGGYLRRQRELLQRWTVGGVHRLPRINPLALQDRW